MPRRIIIDGKKLAQTIEDGTKEAEVMKKFGFKNARELKAAYATPLEGDGRVPATEPGGRKTGKPEAIEMQVKINKRGSLVIPKAAVEKLGYAAGSIFRGRRTKAGIALTRR